MQPGPPRTVLGISFIATVAIVLAACNGEDETPTPRPASTPPPAAGAVGTPATAAFQAAIANFALPNVSVPVGTRVTWTNRDSAPHTVTSGRNGQFDGRGWNSDTLDSGKTFTTTFSQVGTFPYTCRIHPSLNATVTVAQAGQASSTTGEAGGYAY